MQRAFTLPELMLALAVAGILFALALPRLSGALDRVEVQTAASHIAAAHQRARLMAMTHAQVLVLTVNSSALTITRRGDPDPLWSHPGPDIHRVALAGPARQFIFSPEGLTLGLSNATLRLARGAATRTVVVSRLGRVRVTR